MLTVNDLILLFRVEHDMFQTKFGVVSRQLFFQWVVHRSLSRGSVNVNLNYDCNLTHYENEVSHRSLITHHADDDGFVCHVHC